MNLISLTCILAAAIVLLALRRRLASLGPVSPRLEGLLPANAPAPDLLSRVTETLALAAAGVTILIMKSTREGVGGVMLSLDRLDPQFAKMNVVLFAGAAVGTVISILLALLWRTGPAALLMAAVLVTYGWIFGEPVRLLARLTPAEVRHALVEYTIALGDDLAGADVWVNGVFLGRAPVRTTLDDFLEKVPYWSKPPKGYRDGTEDVRLPCYGPRGRSTGIRQRWIPFRRPKCEARFDRRDTSHNTEDRQYYARVSLDGEWGVGFGSGYGGGGGRYRRSYRTTLRVEFLSHRERMEELLDLARLSDYRVEPAWFRAMDSYGKRGWTTLRKAAIHEPDLMEVFDAWAAWRYQIGDDANANTAWPTFLRVCDRAGDRRRYDTASVDGRATELLVPKLDPEQLVSHAETLLERYRGWPGYARREEYGRVHFKLVVPRDGAKARVPPSAAVVAHAIWVLDEQLDRQSDSVPNIVESRLTRAVLRWLRYPHRGDVACALGGGGHRALPHSTRLAMPG